MNFVRTGLCLVAAIFIGAGAEAAAQTENASPLVKWNQTLAELETQVKSLRDDDRQTVADAAARVRALDAEVTEWLQRGWPVDPAPRPGPPVCCRRCLAGAGTPRASARRRGHGRDR
jgi:hypothetical protein